MNWSKQQREVFRFAATGIGNGIISAVAGSGKTTTIVEAAKHIPVTATAAFVAFNKSIATELGKRLPPHVKASTLNAMGFGAWVRKCTGKRLTVDSGKSRMLLTQLVPEQEQRMYGAAIPRLVSLAKAVGIVPSGSRVSTNSGFTEDSEYNWLELIDTYDIDIQEPGTEAGLIHYAMDVLRESIRIADSVIDFDDQLYMPVITRARFFQNDFMFLDEAQDVNLIQREMLRMCLKPKGRLIAVGDPHQAIYGFRGADHGAFDNIRTEFGCTELPLSVSYRCPKAVVLEAQKYVQHIESAPTAVDGLVWQVQQDQVRREFFLNSDIMVCRNSAPLVSAAYKLIRARIACRVVGREIGQGLIALIDKVGGKRADLNTLSEKLAAYRDKEVMRLTLAKQEDKASSLLDKLATIDVFIEEVDPEDYTVQRLKQNINMLFSDDERTGVMRLMTIHKSKGLEAPRVFILNFGLNEKGMKRPGPQQAQEVNLAYVAITRAMRELYYIESEDLDQLGR